METSIYVAETMKNKLWKSVISFNFFYIFNIIIFIDRGGIYLFIFVSLIYFMIVLYLLIRNFISDHDSCRESVISTMVNIKL